MTSGAPGSGEETFETCSMCGQRWATREEFIADPGIELIGYQANFRELTLGAFCFNHTCGTSLAIWASSFTDLYDGPVFQDRLTGQAGCPGYCLDPTNLKPCAQRCECAFVRHVMDAICHWPKTGQDPANPSA